MNRIILIGNGFDLAHGLKTSFSDFLNFYWDNIFNEISLTRKLTRFENENIVIDQIPMTFIEGENQFETIRISVENARTTLRWKNHLLKAITVKNNTEKWVDIENEYYQLLVESFKEQNNNYKISELNQDFDRIKNYLNKYITQIENNAKIENSSCRAQITSKIYSRFEFKDFTEKAINEKAKLELNKAKENFKNAQPDVFVRNKLSEVERRLIDKLGSEDDYLMIRKLLTSDSAPNYFKLFPDNILFLNFNYTKSHKHYINPNTVYFNNLDNNFNTISIHIHGTVYEKEYNPIIFGFGDEIDQNYKTIENLNDNRYLEHIKSIKYLETDNYKKLLEFINSDQYQIFIFGHSCGNSDRTLLNTLFENQNCVSIKPFYYKKQNGQDNFSELSMNITRNFNNKAVLRDKVVNKKFCEPLCLSANNGYHK
ncbi:Bacteriophage abortive infection AbiH [Gillisia sp. Hel1_33_143]|uniref:AbiH family protein n=1 Tax=Gillisia sp. Hel1_33_143 TaxID=1336796 RepID=UPI00087B87F3|nr:AbiH family protein [Gillisia sp. Hel1_33_143]SDS27433.1 Bacteriophage abortive infection AbiH [Gillisia sp. Hel1_33_143]